MPNASPSPDLPTEREALHKLIWSTPVELIMVQFHVIEQTIIERCIELQVPRPLKGYWLARNKGKTPPVPSLRPLKATTSRTKPAPIAPHAIDIISEKDAENTPAKESKRINEKPTLPDSELLLQELEEYLLSSKLNREGYYRPSKRKLLDLNVSDTGYAEAIKILTSLFQALSKNGYAIRIASMSESFRRRDIDLMEIKMGYPMLTTAWKPSSPSMIRIEGIWIGFTLVEMTEYIPAKMVKSRYVRDDKKLNWLRGQKKPHIGYVMEHSLPSGRFKIQFYSPYDYDGWSAQFIQTKTCGLLTQINRMIEALQKAVPVIQKQRSDAAKAAEAARIRHAHEHSEYLAREAIRKKSEALTNSISELQVIMAQWSKDRLIEQFLTEAEQAAEELEAPLREATREKLKLAREFCQGEMALERLVKWKTPQERLSKP